MWPYINVGSPQQNSGVFSGNNYQMGWSAHSKENSNMEISGAQGTLIIGNYNYTLDNDVFDVPNTDNDTAI